MSGLDGMTIWIPDYLSRHASLHRDQHGAFLLVLMAMWRAGGWLPNDASRLARTAKLSLSKWRAISPEIMELLLVEGDRITSARLLRELEKTKQNPGAPRRRLCPTAEGKWIPAGGTKIPALCACGFQHR